MHLEDVLVSEVDEELLAAAIKPYVQIEPETYEVQTLDAFDDLNNIEAAFVLLLGERASSKIKNDTYAEARGIDVEELLSRFNIPPRRWATLEWTNVDFDGGVRVRIWRINDVAEWLQSEGMDRVFIPEEAEAA